MPAFHHREFSLLRSSAEAQHSLVSQSPNAKAIVHPNASFITGITPRRTVRMVSEKDSESESESEVSEEVEEDEVLLTKTTSAIKPCYAFQLFQIGKACNSQKCTFCNNGGKYCLVCQSSQHGAAQCLSDACEKAQLEYFAQVLQPEGKRKSGWDLIYGGAPYKMLGYKSLDELQAAISSKSISQMSYASAARKCRREAVRLKQGGVPKRVFIYPGTRK
jgi:hypothetical protein